MKDDVAGGRSKHGCSLKDGVSDGTKELSGTAL